MSEAGVRRVVATDGTMLVVTDVGDGPPVVLLHGLACVGEMWDPLRALLLPDRRVVVPDLRGHGRSQPVLGGFSRLQQAEDVASVLDDLDLRDAVLVGHSGGGYAALAFLANHRRMAEDRLRGVVTVGTAGSLVGLRERLVLRFSASRAFYALVGVGPVGRALVRVGAFGRRPDPALVEQTRRMALGCPRLTKAGWVQAVSGTSIQDSLRGVDVAILATTGARDRTVTPASVKELAAAAGDDGAGASWVAIVDAGHMVPLEVPEELARLIDSIGPREDRDRL